MNRLKKYEPIFNAWNIRKLIGQGSFGKVYEIERKERSNTYRAALKVITIPQNESELKSIMADGMSKEDVTGYYETIVNEIVGEFVMMSKLKGNSNVVSYEDHMLMEHEDGIGWDILIRMELLTSLIDHAAKSPMQEEDVINLGIDLCRALELCRKHNIIHRDIKPENIFISENGDYKLGDFGIAKTVEKTSSGLSRKGTYSYMAPEAYKGEAYGASVDIYSLGIVMYRLLNDNRTPFMPDFPKPITYTDRENALLKRIGGEPIPTPKTGSRELQQIVLKACAYHSKERFVTAEDMRMALEELVWKRKKEAEKTVNEGELTEHLEKTEETVALDIVDEKVAADISEVTEVIQQDTEVESTELINKEILQQSVQETDTSDKDAKGVEEKAEQKELMRKAAEKERDKELKHINRKMVVIGIVCLLMAVVAAGILMSDYKDYDESAYLEYNCGDIKVRIPESKLVNDKYIGERSSGLIEEFRMLYVDVESEVPFLYDIQDAWFMNYYSDTSERSKLIASYLSKDDYEIFSVHDINYEDHYDNEVQVERYSVDHPVFEQCDYIVCEDGIFDNTPFAHVSFAYKDKFYWLYLESRGANDVELQNLIDDITFSDEPQ